jgi:hypothetical protein
MAKKKPAKRKVAKKASKVRVAPFVPSFVRLGTRDFVNQVLNDATWTVITPDWGKWVQTKHDETWESLPVAPGSTSQATSRRR